MPTELVENFVNGNRTAVVDAILQDTNSPARVAYLTAGVMHGLANRPHARATTSIFMDMLYSRSGET